MNVYFDLTKEETNAIRCLKSLAKRWPKTLWLFAGPSGGLDVMRCGENGVPKFAGGRVDPEYIVDYVDISADGGDF